ncbi:phage terminase large subunit GpA-like protein [Natronocella acetinitrilica]|uniref:Phage terminase large subunit GpA-like protein n=1 Tax=Natronocella acetinitrilica TaxID=414046 RepID=A0AAE3KC87_9GAMM|nr:terminase gpA endonuclease subunit [Natronocella acetinitrilica]MCP1675471.1 phage terminase large subunit GpA-like protein [Natronocella acetinitrilica]
MSAAEQYTLTDLQAERERLKAEQAQEEYEAAVAETCLADELYAAEAAAHHALLQGLANLDDRLVTAIAGMEDETAIHHALSEVIHDVLREVGESVSAATQDVLPLVGEAVQKGVKPRGLLTVSQWADRHRWLESGTNAPGQWDTDRNPLLREIMDSLSEHSPVREVTFKKPSGIGGTEVLYNWIGYIMHHLQNKDLLLVVPTLELRDREFNPRLRKVINETTVLKDLVSTASRNKTNRDDLLEYGARARIIKAGANSADSLRSSHIPYVAKDEASAFPWDVGGEGDPDRLIANRQRTFTRAKTYNCSTPTIEGACRIDRGYQRSDQRTPHVACPHCDHSFYMQRKKHLNWKTAPPREGDSGQAELVTDAWVNCPECGGEIREAEKPPLLANARWVPKRPHIKHHRGYTANSLYTPLGLGLTWKQIAQDALDAEGDDAAMQTIVNTYDGEVWTEQGDSIDDLQLMTRLENYQRDELPIVLVTAGVDVQKDRLEVTITGFGAGEEAWLLDHLILPGETAEYGEGAWLELDPALEDNGVQYYCVDSGYNADAVYAAVDGRPYAWAIKGIFGMNRPLVEDERRRRQRRRYRRKRGVPIEPIGVDTAKSILYARLKLPAAQGACPGYIHFANHPAFDDEYFAQLGAEKLVPRRQRGRTVLEWRKFRARNEALDCLIYALAACRLSGVDLDAEAKAGRFVTLSAGEYQRVKQEAANSSAKAEKPARQDDTTTFYDAEDPWLT